MKRLAKSPTNAPLSIWSQTPDPGPTLSEQAYHLLRKNILRGRLAPGQKLKIGELQQKHELSSSPLREALNRLVTEGLVAADGHRGFRAAPISSVDLRDLTSLRLIVEQRAFETSIEHGRDDWQAAIVAALFRLERVGKPSPSGEHVTQDDWIDRHRDFHMALLSACPYPRMIELCSSLFDQAERYRRFCMASPNKPRNTAGEHRAIMESALARNTQTALKLHAEHIQRTADNGVSFLEKIERPLSRKARLAG